MNDQPNLFEPLQVGPLEISNRIVFGPHTTEFGHRTLPTSRHTAYYEERARGGVGLIISESSYVHPSSLSKANSILSCNPDAVGPFAEIARAVHAHDVPIVGQLSHRGRQMTGVHSRLPVWGVSPIPCPVNREIPHEVTEAEIDELVAGYAAAARNYREAGYDGVEIHAAHGYLIEQFWSPWTNKRTDRFGGSLANRIRFSRLVIEAVRATVSSGMAVGMRVSAEELVPEGLQREDVLAILAELTKAGALDYVSVSIGTHSSVDVMIGDMSLPQGYAVPLAAEIRRTLTVPVFAGLRIKEPDMAAQVVASGSADAVVMVRPLIADPEWANKVRGSRPQSIRHCVAANQDCRNHHRGAAIQCVQNPAVGRESELGIGSIGPAPVRKRVLVVGGGPAGMEAARVSALRGHEVTLVERAGELGGQVTVAAAVGSRRELSDVNRYLVPQLDELGVEVVLGTAVSADNLVDYDPDVVVLAVGSVAAPAPEVVQQAQGVEVLHVRDVLAGAVVAPGGVVIYDELEGFWHACSAAEFLAARGNAVTVVTPLGSVGIDIPKESVRPTHRRLRELGVALRPGSVVTGVDRDGVVHLRSTATGEAQSLPACRTVVTTGSRSDVTLANDLRTAYPDREVHVIGDALAPRRITHAIREGNLTARAL